MYREFDTHIIDSSSFGSCGGCVAIFLGRLTLAAKMSLFLGNNWPGSKMISFKVWKEDAMEAIQMLLIMRLWAELSKENHEL